MILAAELVANIRIGVGGQLPGQVHGNLPGLYQGFVPLGRLQIGCFDVEMSGDCFLNMIS